MKSNLGSHLIGDLIDEHEKWHRHGDIFYEVVSDRWPMVHNLVIYMMPPGTSFSAGADLSDDEVMSIENKTCSVYSPITKRFCKLNRFYINTTRVSALKDGESVDLGVSRYEAYSVALECGRYVSVDQQGRVTRTNLPTPSLCAAHWYHSNHLQHQVHTITRIPPSMTAIELTAALNAVLTDYTASPDNQGKHVRIERNA